MAFRRRPASIMPVRRSLGLSAVSAPCAKRSRGRGTTETMVAALSSPPPSDRSNRGDCQNQNSRNNPHTRPLTYSRPSPHPPSVPSPFRTSVDASRVFRGKIIIFMAVNELCCEGRPPPFSSPSYNGHASEKLASALKNTSERKKTQTPPMDGDRASGVSLPPVTGRAAQSFRWFRARDPGP